jgi:phage terminase large subunit-like protein
MQELAALSPAAQRTFLAAQPDWALQDMARGEWWWVGRPEQQEPKGNWFVWLLLSGRGFGKTRTAAEWLIHRLLKHPVDVNGFRTEWLLIAETLSDALRQCVDGPAGVRRVLERRLGPEQRNRHDGTGKWKLWKSPKAFIELATGQVIYIEGADDEDVGRGYNAAGAWLDEFAKWKKADASWQEGIMPSLRADLPDGDFPRCIVATTPKLVAQLLEWKNRRDGSVHLTTGSTYANAINLAAAVVAELAKRYEGTRLGRQELHGELIEEVQGALWSYAWIENDRVSAAQVPNLNLRVIGMDPSGSGTRDETGLIAVGRGTDGADYVLGDWSKMIAGHGAARRAWEMYRAYSADLIVIEAQPAKKWLRDTMRQAYQEMQAEGLFPTGGQAPIKEVTAKVGKRLRAEPVAARYEQGGRVHHVRGQNLGQLETQLISWVPEETADSPDRLDALVYAELSLYDRERMTVQAATPVGAAVQATPLSPLVGGPMRRPHTGPLTMGQ